MRTKNVFSNTLLVFGTCLLIGFVVLELLGMHSDPLVPAFSAFLIGCTAVLDRMGEAKLKQS